MTCGHCQRQIEACELHSATPGIPCYGFRHFLGAHICPTPGVSIAEPPRNPRSL